MITILVFFVLSVLVSIFVTPYVGKLGRWIGALDYPDERKIHSGVIPRCGGLAIYLAFFLPFLLVFSFQTPVTELLPWGKRAFAFWAGGSLILLIGLWDDIWGLKASTKLLLQVVVALFGWWGGFQINGVLFPYLGKIEFSWLGLPVTVFWFLIVINAINLMDGLDGLAAGIAFFASIVLAVVSLLRTNYLAALMFASFSGALLGFLRYNFHPASVFLGDSGSYFVGFVLAALGIGTLQKSSVAVAILIPVVALGLPLMDVFFAAIRRFVYGADIFAPDKKHLHHRLLQLGYTPRRATFILLSVTIVFGLLALMIENLRDNRVGLVLGAISVLSIVGMRRLGYLDYFNAGRLFAWISDITDEAGITRDRRAFLGNQVAISGSENIYQFWGRVVHAAQMIRLNAVYLEPSPEVSDSYILPCFAWEDGSLEKPGEKANGRCLTIELPLVSNGKYYGVMHVKRSVQGTGNDNIMLRRIEQLRRSVIEGLEKLAVRSLSRSGIMVDRRNGGSKIRLAVEKLTGLDTPGLGDYRGIDRRKFQWEKTRKRMRQGALGGPVTTVNRGKKAAATLFTLV
ncbi:MAG: hypothetical protein GTO24_00170 [candidate division Zixibacteria bacterium]|nr:hypothetical protein [candidate division Zixibacteria bacterium]